jgi:hypothetical protein
MRKQRTKTMADESVVDAVEHTKARLWMRNQRTKTSRRTKVLSMQCRDRPKETSDAQAEGRKFPADESVVDAVEETKGGFDDKQRTTTSRRTKVLSMQWNIPKETSMRKQ